jgi:ubiquitin-protein ligase
MKMRGISIIKVNHMSISFKDLVNFDDPLNTDAANLYQTNKEMFTRKVKEYISRYC